MVFFQCILRNENNNFGGRDGFRRMCARGMSLHVEDLVMNFVQLLSIFNVNLVSVLEETLLNYAFFLHLIIIADGLNFSG